MPEMPPIPADDRRVANIHTGTFEPLVGENGQPDGEVLQVNGGRKGHGFHVYRMQAGATTVAHEHVGDEEFLLIEGDLVDNDGTRYVHGDLVWLRSGTTHNSYSENGCVLAVYLPDSRAAG